MTYILARISFYAKYICKIFFSVYLYKYNFIFHIKYNYQKIIFTKKIKRKMYEQFIYDKMQCININQ